MANKNKTATFIKKIEGWIADARLVHLSAPVAYQIFNETGESEERTTDHVIVSAVNAFYSGDETYIFPADSDGEALNMCELEGSFKGYQDHAEALRRAGYVITAEVAS